MSETREVANYDEHYAKEMERYAAEWQPEGKNFLSTKSGVLSYNEIDMPGNQILAIVLDAVHENTYYSAKYDANVPAPPTCYAYTRNKTEPMYPHESMALHPDTFVVQSDTCNKCQWNEWGTADVGRGKACQNRARLALLAAGVYIPRKGSRDFDIELFNDPRDLSQADIVMLKLPPTSVAEWEKYVQQVGATFKRPPYGMVTRIYLEPHAKHQFHVKFEAVEPLDDALFQAVYARHQEAEKTTITAYSPPMERDEPEGTKRNALRRAR